MTEIIQQQPAIHPTVNSAWEKWIQFAYWLSGTRFVLRQGAGFTHFTKFQSLAKALRRAGVHYFEYKGLVIWELGPKAGEKSGVHVHQFLITLRCTSEGQCPDFPLSTKQLTADELHLLCALSNSTALVGRETIPADTTLVVIKKTAPAKLNRRRKGNQRVQEELDMLTPPVTHVDALNSTAYTSAEYAFGLVPQPSTPFVELQQMHSVTAALTAPHSPYSESYSSPAWSVNSASDSDGLDDSSFQPLFSFDLMDSVQFHF
eukprot:TRINITY_DN13652_c0_g1_i1.p1 TRINITY_DN13652_c0_g1~~TRINITY_DN13652_c0_g1_i1.p1  ORF type:complete len:271 (+),score=40.40 TRINITY_DN13652_c0_g1_i1:33-815(+)